MKKFLILTLALFIILNGWSQKQPAIPNQVAPHIAAAPKASVQPVSGTKQTPASLSGLKFVIANKWRGARITQHANSVTVDSLWFEFSLNGTFRFKHQAYELNGPVDGTYTINGNSIKMIATKFPFSHTFTGTYDAATGILSGSFTEVRSTDPSQPPYYSAGTFSGSFNLIIY